MLKKSITELFGRIADLEYSRETRRALALVAALVLATGALLFFISQGSSSAATTPVPTGVLVPAPEKPILITVDVAGKVRRPGVYSLPQGSRAIDAITAAGNKLPGIDTSDINLAHRLVDGEQIVVGAPRYIPSTRTSKGQTPKKSGPVSINTGTQAELETLPGIGPVMARRIITYRLAHGAFQSIDDLKKITGFHKNTFAEISSLVRL